MSVQLSTVLASKRWQQLLQTRQQTYTVLYDGVALMLTDARPTLAGHNTSNGTAGTAPHEALHAASCAPVTEATAPLLLGCPVAPGLLMRQTAPPTCC
jgi:hypothetical protein